MIVAIGALVARPAVVARIRGRSLRAAHRRRESGSDGGDGSGSPDEGHEGAEGGDGDGDGGGGND